MNCAWESFIQLIPLWMREKVNNLGKESLLELRLRINSPPELVFAEDSKFLTRRVTSEDIQLCINLATKYSPWANETTSEGFITVPGGHRIGLCGTIIHGINAKQTFTTITSISIRIARDFPGIAKGIPLDHSILIIGKPGSGKTTFLRDLIRQNSSVGRNRIAVIDERQEIFPFVNKSFCYDTGNRIDVISGCRKADGIEIALRCMTPTTIAVDEITSASDTDAILQCVGCGVSLVATAHAFNLADLKARPIYKTLLHCNIFQKIIILSQNKLWHWEIVNL